MHDFNGIEIYLVFYQGEDVRVKHLNLHRWKSLSLHAQTQSWLMQVTSANYYNLYAALHRCFSCHNVILQLLPILLVCQSWRRFRLAFVMIYLCMLECKLKLLSREICILLFYVYMCYQLVSELPTFFLYLFLNFIHDHSHLCIVRMKH